MSNYENNLRQEDLSIHDWYRFVLSFPPHLVRQYIDSFGIDNHNIVLEIKTQNLIQSTAA